MDKLLNHRKHRITQLSPFSLKRRAKLFSTTFTFLWLLLDPQEYFDITPRWLVNLGVWGYGILFIISILISLLVEAYVHYRMLGQIELITVTVVVPFDGSRHLLECPIDMRVDVLINKFLAYIGGSPTYDILLKCQYFYDWNLLQKDGQTGLDNYKTLRNCGAHNNSEYLLQWIPKSFPDISLSTTMNFTNLYQ